MRSPGARKWGVEWRVLIRMSNEVQLYHWLTVFVTPPKPSTHTHTLYIAYAYCILLDSSWQKLVLFHFDLCCHGLINTACEKFILFCFYTVTMLLQCEIVKEHHVLFFFFAVWLTVVDFMQVPVPQFVFVLQVTQDHACCQPLTSHGAQKPAKTSRIQALPSCTVDLMWNQKPAWNTCLPNIKNRDQMAIMTFHWRTMEEALWLVVQPTTRGRVRGFVFILWKRSWLPFLYTVLWKMENYVPPLSFQFFFSYFSHLNVSDHKKQI